MILFFLKRVGDRPNKGYSIDRDGKNTRESGELKMCCGTCQREINLPSNGQILCDNCWEVESRIEKYLKHPNAMAKIFRIIAKIIDESILSTDVFVEKCKNCSRMSAEDSIFCSGRCSDEYYGYFQ